MSLNPGDRTVALVNALAPWISQVERPELAGATPGVVQQVRVEVQPGEPGVVAGAAASARAFAI